MRKKKKLAATKSKSQKPSKLKKKDIKKCIYKLFLLRGSTILIVYLKIVTGAKFKHLLSRKL